MMLLVLLIVMMPLSATTAGLFIWAGHRDESLDDGALVRQFLIAMVVVMALLWAISRKDSVRMRLDPMYRIQTQIESDPVYSTAKRLDSDTANVLRPFLEQQMFAGATLPQAMSLARLRLTNVVTERLGFADQATHILWGRLVADSLRELRTADPDLCYAVIASQVQDPKVLAQVFSAENSARFQQVVVAVYESANRGMSHDRPREDHYATHDEAVLEFRAIQAEIEERFDSSIAAQTAQGTSRKFLTTPLDSPKQLCSARIFQLEEMLKRPKPIASTLLDSVLR